MVNANAPADTSANQETVVWRFPWKRIDPVRVDLAVAAALGEFPGARVSGRGVLATATAAPNSARTFVIAFPVDLVSSSLEAFEHPPPTVDGMAYGRFVILADDDLGAGALLEARRNEGMFTLMKRLVASIASRLDGVEDGDRVTSAKALLPSLFSRWDDVMNWARAQHEVADVEEDSFMLDVRVPGTSSQQVEVLTFEAWSEPWIVLWSTVCGADQLTAEEAIGRNADATFAVLAKDEDVYRVCWSCPLRVLSGARFDQMLSRFAEEAATLRDELDPA